MRLIYFFILACFSSCGSTPTRDGIFTAISNGNQTLEGKLIGLEGKSLSGLKLENIISASNEMDSEDKLFVRYRAILKEAQDIKIYPREESFVICMKWMDTYFCDLSECMGIEYSSTMKQLAKPQELKCK